MITLRDYQEEAIAALFAYFEEHDGNPLLVLPTGSGKSVVQAAFLERMERLYPGQRVLLLTHVKELIEQNYLKFRTLLPGVPCGIHSASFGRKDIGHRFMFCGIQSIWRKADKIGPYDLI